MQNHLTKECSKCQEEKSLIDFCSKKDGRLGVRSECKVCQAKYSKSYYKNNKDEVLERNRQRRTNNIDIVLRKEKERRDTNKERDKQSRDSYRSRNIKYVLDIKNESKCCICGESSSPCLDFDHIDTKLKRNTVANLSAQGYSLDVVRTEISKCQIICANCHREKHFRNATSCNKKEEYIRSIKVKSSCKTCGKKEIPCLTFHHRDPDTKLFSLGRFKHSKTTIEMIDEEIQKCDILCENCHRKLHHRLRNIECTGD